MEYRRRQSRLTGSLAEQRANAFLVTHLPNVRYLCGFTGSNGVLAVHLPRTGRAQTVLFTDGRYTIQAKQEVKGAKVSISRQSALAAAVEWLTHQTRGSMRCGFEAEHTPYTSFQSLKRLGGAKVAWQPTTSIIECLRIVKDSAEISGIRKAVNLASRVFESVLPDIKPGMPENALAAEIEYLCRRLGVEGMSFETIVAGGKRSAMPHGVASNKPLPENGFVIMDFGVKLNGYCSDMTRTVHLGRVNRRSARIYEAVKASQEAGIKAVKPGILTSEVDQACRKTLEKYGFGRYFTHSTGHGVGLEIHELPGLRAAPAVKKSAGKPAAKGRIGSLKNAHLSDRLLPGMVLTIEPGVYISGLGGVRIEDMVVVTKTGCEVLTPTTKELLVL